MYAAHANTGAIRPLVRTPAPLPLKPGLSRISQHRGKLKCVWAPAQTQSAGQLTSCPGQRPSVHFTQLSTAAANLGVQAPACCNTATKWVGSGVVILRCSSGQHHDKLVCGATLSSHHQLPAGRSAAAAVIGRQTLLWHGLKRPRTDPLRRRNWLVARVRCSTRLWAGRNTVQPSPHRQS